ncbi:RICIN domain-containing protein [Kribbella sp. NBC_01505]|uniref:RICIN domain-containing protein n=1 Tax=Kribbella sp. NBC_01505 TaxID=2903580 RepID=UPI0038657551
MRIKAKLAMAVVVGVAALAGPVAASAAPAPAPVAGKATLIPGQPLVKPTQKAAAADWGYLRNEATGRCLEERPGRAIGTGGVPCRLDNDQTWQWQYMGDVSGVATWQLVNRSTNNCLDGANGGVYSNPCNSGIYQGWIRYQSGAIQHLGSNGTVLLDSNAQGSAYLLADNGSGYQRWY